MKMRLYLDVCTLCRPYDDQSQLRVRMETDAVLLIMGAIQSDMYVLKRSRVHFVETRDIHDDKERVDIEKFLLSYGEDVSGDEKAIRERTKYLCAQGIGIADAAHLAFAETGADVLVSCDDRFVKRGRKLVTSCEILTPSVFCEKENLR